jgi:hypothetical protein
LKNPKNLEKLKNLKKLKNLIVRWNLRFY